MNSKTKNLSLAPQFALDRIFDNHESPTGGQPRKKVAGQSLRPGSDKEAKYSRMKASALGECLALVDKGTLFIIIILDKKSWGWSETS